MKAKSYDEAQRVLSEYLEHNKCRKTPERFAVLEAIYGFSSYFSIQDLDVKLTDMNFPVCRATLYNTIKLFVELHLIECIRMQGGMRYKAVYSDRLCTQICTICGKITEVKLPEVDEVFEHVHLKRFRKESYSVCIYGVCSTCQAMLTRQKKKENTNSRL